MRAAPLELRRAAAADIETLRTLYAAAVDRVGPGAYSPQQVAAWRAFAADPAFADFISGVDTWLAVHGAAVAGFCGIAEDGHVASLYVSPDRLRRGIGTALLNATLQRHPAPRGGRYYAEASVFSLPLFESCGFRLVGRETSVRQGVSFERFLVERRVDATA